MKKVKVHRPAECRCRHCCSTPAERRHALLNQKRRLVGPQRQFTPWPKYVVRRKLTPFEFAWATQKVKVRRFYRWKNSVWEARQAFKDITSDA